MVLHYTTQDLLPHLPNFTEIELFQDEICQTLQDCGDNIQYLKNQMRELAESADSTVLVSSCDEILSIIMICFGNICVVCAVVFCIYT